MAHERIDGPTDAVDPPDRADETGESDDQVAGADSGDERRVGRWTVLRRAWRAAKGDRIPLVSAGVAFFAFLSLIPTLIAVVLVYGLLSDPDEVTQQVEDYASALPSGAQDLVIEQLEAVAAGPQRGLGIGLALALGVALWSASAAMSNMITAVNLAHDREDNRGIVKSKALALGLTLGAIAFFVVAIALVAAMPVVANALDLPRSIDIVLEVARWIVLVLAVVVALGLLYRWAPERRPPDFRWFTFGAIVATILWIMASAGFAIYVDTFGNYAQTYGSLAGIVVLLLWFWISAFAALFGAEINVETERNGALPTS